jgi:serine/threonine-protein kinase
METSEAKPVVDGPFNQMTAALSHDGKWLAYSSNESGTDEVYVQAFPEPKGRWMISTNGGYEPMWRSDDREIFYLRDTNIAAVSVEPGSNFSFGTPETLFSTIIRGAQRSGYSLSAPNALATP